MIKKWIKKIVREVLQEEKIIPGPHKHLGLGEIVHRTPGPQFKEVFTAPITSASQAEHDPRAAVILKVAQKAGIHFLDYHPTGKYIRFGDASMFIDVWYTKMTVGTNIKHPIKGWNRLYRKHVSLQELEQIFKNPRQHTGKGYR